MGPRKKITGILRSSLSIFEPARVSLECGHEARTWAGRSAPAIGAWAHCKECVSMKNVIEGIWDDKDWYGAVTMDGALLRPGRSQRVINHSPDGFAWGYGGSGPAQLALAILLAAGVPA